MIVHGHLDNGNTNCFCVPLRPNIQEIINNTTTGDINNIIADLWSVLKELHHKTGKRSVKIKQILISAISAVDSNDTLPIPIPSNIYVVNLFCYKNDKYVVWNVALSLLMS